MDEKMHKEKEMYFKCMHSSSTAKCISNEYILLIHSKSYPWLQREAYAKVPLDAEEEFRSLKFFFFLTEMLVYFDLLEPEDEVEKQLSMKKYIYIYLCCWYFGGDAVENDD